MPCCCCRHCMLHLLSMKLSYECSYHALTRCASPDFRVNKSASDLVTLLVGLTPCTAVWQAVKGSLQSDCITWIWLIGRGRWPNCMIWLVIMAVTA